MNKGSKRFLKVVGLIMAIVAVLFIVAYLLTMGTYEIPKTLVQDPSLPKIQLNGYTFHAETFGAEANPVVIMLHGGPGGDYRYMYSLKELASDHFLVYYDQRGTGLSPRVPAETINLETYYNDVDAFVEHFGKGKPVYIIGHSWGAMLGSGYACKKPGKVAKLVLAEPGFLKVEMSGPATKFNFSFSLLYNMGKTWFQALHLGNEPDRNAAGDYFLGQMLTFFTPDYNCGGIMPESVEVWRSGQVSWEALAGRMMKDEQYRDSIDFVAGVENFDKKVLFIASECNTLIGEAHQRQQMKYFPDAELVVIKGAGHYMFNEKPEASVATIRKYFKEAAPPAEAVEEPNQE